MIQLQPLPDVDFQCPYCQIQLAVAGWKMPGMRMLAELTCRTCSREYYGDLPSGHGLYYPMLLEKGEEIVHDPAGAKWFSKYLRSSYARRMDTPVGFRVETFKQVNNPILLNCLDGLYGHSLLKLLGVDYYLTHHAELDVIVLIPKSLRWLVPEGVAEIWVVDAPLSFDWNEWLDREIHQRLSAFSTCKLGLGLSHPHSKDFNLSKFTKVSPFPVNEWAAGLKKPCITYIWREDRLWNPELGGISFLPISDEQRQVQAVIELYTRLYELLPSLEFYIVGLGNTGSFPEPIKDLRQIHMNDQIEQEWCRLYSQSICVIGIHGSNMLLPSGLAGSVVELVPLDRWGNLVEDIILSIEDPREALFRMRFVPSNTPPDIVAALCSNILLHYEDEMLNFQDPWSRYEFVSRQPDILRKKLLSFRENQI